MSETKKHERCERCGGTYAGLYCGAPACVKANDSKPEIAAEPKSEVPAVEPEPAVEPKPAVEPEKPSAAEAEPEKARRRR